MRTSSLTLEKTCSLVSNLTIVRCSKHKFTATVETSIFRIPFDSVFDWVQFLQKVYSLSFCRCSFHFAFGHRLDFDQCVLSGTLRQEVGLAVYVICFPQNIWEAALKESQKRKQTVSHLIKACNACTSTASLPESKVASLTLQEDYLLESASSQWGWSETYPSPFTNWKGTHLLWYFAAQSFTANFDIPLPVRSPKSSTVERG